VVLCRWLSCLMYGTHCPNNAQSARWTHPGIGCNASEPDSRGPRGLLVPREYGLWGGARLMLVLG